VIRVAAGMSTTRFCALIDMPERTWRRWQAKARAGGQVKGAVAEAVAGLGSGVGP
jgi:putative transposase